MADESSFAGTLSRVVHWPFAPSATWVAASYRIQSNPAAMIGMGAENAAGAANKSPVAVPMTGTAVAGSEATFDVAQRGWDPEGGTLTAYLPASPTQGTSRIVAGKVGYTPQGGTGGQVHNVPVGVKDAALQSSTSIIRVSVSAPAVGGAYTWTHAFPNAAAVDSTKVKIWNIGSTVPSHSVGDIIVGSGPPGAITDAHFVASNFKGPLVLVGLDLRPTGGRSVASYSTAAAPVLGTDALIQPSFTSDARSHWAWEGRNWPFLFLANIYVDYQTNACSFGDFIRVNQQGSQANDAVTKAFAGPKAIVIQNKIYMNKGPHYVSNTSISNGHSDGIQSLGGIPVYRAADCYFNWPGGQIYFSGREAQDCGWPRSTRWDLRNVAMDHAAFWNSNVQAHSLNTYANFIKATEDAADGGPYVELYNYDLGQYMSVYFGSQCYVRSRFPWGDVGIKKYIAGTGGIVTYPTSGNPSWTFKTEKLGGHTYPAYAGQVRYIPPGSPLPQTCDPAQTGSGFRITSVDQFMSIIRGV